MKITIKEMLTFVPIGAFIAGYSFLFGLLSPLGFEALSTLTYVDVVEASIANVLFILIIMATFLLYARNPLISGDEIKPVGVITISLILAIISLFMIFVFDNWEFLLIFAVVAAVVLINTTLKKKEYRLGALGVAIVIFMSIQLTLYGQQTTEVVDKVSNPKIMLKNRQGDNLLLVFSLDRNVLAYSTDNETYKLIPHDQVSYLEFRK